MGVLNFSDFADIENLIKTKTEEEDGLEFKQELWAQNDEGKREMLKDICSFVNSNGGYLIIGIKEKDNKADSIVSVENAENEKDKIFQTCKDNIDPVIDNLTIKCLKNPDKEQEKVLVIEVPKNTDGPHLITFKGLNQFWIRTGRSKSKMEREQIKNAFLKNDKNETLMKNFISERKKKIKAKGNGTFLYLSAYFCSEKKDLLNLRDDKLKKILLSNEKEPDKESGSLDFISPTKVKIFDEAIFVEDESVNWRRLELHKNCYFEAVVRKNEKFGDIFYPEGKNNFLDEKILFKYIENFFAKLKKILEHINYNNSIYINLHLNDIQNYKIEPKNWYDATRDVGKYTDDELTIGPIQILFTDVSKKEYIKKIMNKIVNDFGYENFYL